MRIEIVNEDFLLGTGMVTQDTSSSVLLFFDKQRFIFNVVERWSFVALDRAVNFLGKCPFFKGQDLHQREKKS
ncbi:receptor like protein 19 [Prunus dulcis]|uniref:Receptor like protein 19 n=1 Tax=Prunus dulcis TaxID=3755 RepID=A0A4Y1RJS7_PRUDU|nr:receptor like protein 19 [Prunus dulcis]